MEVNDPIFLTVAADGSHWCRLCGMWAGDGTICDGHLAGKTHRNNVTKYTTSFRNWREMDPQYDPNHDPAALAVPLQYVPTVNSLMDRMERLYEDFSKVHSHMRDRLRDVEEAVETLVRDRSRSRSRARRLRRRH